MTKNNEQDGVETERTWVGIYNLSSSHGQLSLT